MPFNGPFYASMGFAEIPADRCSATIADLVAAERAAGMEQHIGYYVRPSARRQGLATQALCLALQEIVKIGVRSVMLTTNPSNVWPIRVIEDNGGTLKAQRPTRDGADTISQYWIELGR